MPARHKSRARALQVLYTHDMRGGSLLETIDNYYDTLHSDQDEPAERQLADPFMEKLVRGAAEKTPDLDKLIGDRSANWRLERMSVVDRNILRLAVYEMTELKTPPAVVIDEAIELARQFSGDDSASFINGVLDAVRKDLKLEPK